MLAVNISADIELRATIVAESTGRPVLAILEEALAEGLSDLEAVAVAEARLDDIYSGKARPLSHEELFSDGMEA